MGNQTQKSTCENFSFDTSHLVLPNISTPAEFFFFPGLSPLYVLSSFFARVPTLSDFGYLDTEQLYSNTHWVGGESEALKHLSDYIRKRKDPKPVSVSAASRPRLPGRYAIDFNIA